MKRSAGLLVYRVRHGVLEVLLGHPGGPYFARKDDGVWTIPKGEYGPEEEPLAAAVREFTEEIGTAPPDGGDALPLGETLQSNGKVAVVWAVEGDLDVTEISCNLFEMEWPPRTGRRQSFPELDRAAWFDLATARRKAFASQGPFFDRLLEHLAEQPGT
ncbi:MAG TPA: NUDIX domain-containing protein [Mycobacteriales bacterium]|nr:NUDIX domain-containing protein [Mycobacteriales bacterium]